MFLFSCSLFELSVAGYNYLKVDLPFFKVLDSHGDCCLKAKTSACAVECFQSKMINKIDKGCQSKEEVKYEK